MITLNDGTEIKGLIKGIKIKKGLIKSLKVQKGEEWITLKSSDIKHMYAAPTGFEKLAKKISYITDADKWGSPDVKADYLDMGYGYFEQSMVQIKKKQKALLVQLLNPSFCKRVKIYADPFAEETMGVGIGPVEVGSYEKSYYIKLSGENVAYLLKKKQYKGDFATIWKGCASLNGKYDKIKWKDFVQHIIDFTECK